MYKILLAILLSSSLLAEFKVGDEAPTFFVRDLAEKNFFFSDTLKSGKPAVLSFFATWCGPCRAEMPELDTLSHSYKDINFYLVNVSGLQQGERVLKEDPKQVRKMIESLGTKMPVHMDKYGNAAKKYEALILPRLVIIDSGKIAYAHTGYDDNDDKKFIEVLKGLVFEDK